jgi:hypothetical protein
VGMGRAGLKAQRTISAYWFSNEAIASSMRKKLKGM